ncbi:MAG: SCO family protein [Flavobacteriaceae bacterium]|jgi:protein SCO1/2|nr:SCO family protein [Flavobacteriaceae bacterium]MDG2314301.1 SCO family protein [Flavobacteriaceae bacterium]
MKNYSYVGISFIILVFGIIFIPRIIDRIQSGSTLDGDRLNRTSNSDLAYISLNGERKKVPEFLLTNQDNLPISNEDFLGKVYVVEFFFTSCPSICPIMNRNMKILEEKYGDRTDFGIASITIDPENDTPMELKKYAEIYDVFSPNWHFLTGERSYIYELANSGFNIFAEINPAVAGGFEHQGYFALVDQNGYLRSRRDDYGNPIVYYLGIDNDDAEVQDITLLKQDIQILLND